MWSGFRETKSNELFRGPLISGKMSLIEVTVTNTTKDQEI